MSNTTLKHPIITNHYEIKSICKPLEILNITYFSHVRIDDSKNFSFICNNPKFMKHYIKMKYYNADIHMANKEIFKNYVLWDAINRQGKTKQMEYDAIKLGIYHTFTIIEQSKQGYEYYHFSNNSYDPSINHVFLSNLDLLKNFIRYFNEKLDEDKLFIDAHNIKFKPDYVNGNYDFDSSLLAPITEMKRKNFINLLNMSHNKIINDTLMEIIQTYFKKVSKRELQIAIMLLKGKSGRAIAEDLNLSRKTVEHYTDNLKGKIGAETKTDLIELLTNKLFSVLLFGVAYMDSSVLPREMLRVNSIR